MTGCLMATLGNSTDEKWVDSQSLRRVSLLATSHPKIFCIGSGKTGTTSMGAVLQMLGFSLGDQAHGELLLHAWAKRKFAPIIEMCRTAQAFQDIPFCLDDTYAALDQAYPGSKFILTVRDSPEQWYESLVRFLTKLLNRQRLPTADDLKAFGYRYDGWLWQAHQLIYGIDEATLFDRSIYMANYESHLQGVCDYFRGRDNLLVLNLKTADAMTRLCQFLGVEVDGISMPHLNASRAA